MEILKYIRKNSGSHSCIQNDFSLFKKFFLTLHPYLNTNKPYLLTKIINHGRSCF